MVVPVVGGGGSLVAAWMTPGAPRLLGSCERSCYILLRIRHGWGRTTVLASSMELSLLVIPPSKDLANLCIGLEGQ